MDTTKITDLPMANALMSSDMLYVVQNDDGLKSKKTDVDGIYNGIKNSILNNSEFLENIFTQPGFVGADRFIDYSSISALSDVLTGESTHTMLSDSVIITQYNHLDQRLEINGIDIQAQETNPVIELVHNKFVGSIDEHLKLYIKKGTQLRGASRPRGIIYPINTIGGEDANYTGNFIDYGNAMKFNLNSFYGNIEMPFDCVVNVPFLSADTQALSSIDNYIMPSDTASYQRIFAIGTPAGHIPNTGDYQRNPAFMYFKAGTVLGLKKNAAGGSVNNIYIAPVVGGNDINTVQPISVALSSFIANQSNSFANMAGIYDQLSTYVDDLSISISNRSIDGIVGSMTLSVQIVQS